jgi:putative addiction module component (TIGR02574 family)
MRALEIPHFERLSDVERVALAEDILSSLRDAESLPSPIAHHVELDRRWAAFQANPALALSKEQFHKRVATLKR